MQDEDKLPSANLPVVDRQIDGVPYHVQRLGWWAMADGIRMLEDVLGESIRSLLDSSGSIANIMESTGTGAALTGFARRCFGVDGKALLIMLGRQTMVEVDGRKVFLTEAVMDTWFAQHPDHAIPWLLLCLEVQYADFIKPLLTALRPHLAGALAAAKTETTPALKSQST
jgi:hypothetical protein